MTDDITDADGIESLSVAEAASHPDARILPRVDEPAAGENHALDEYRTNTTQP